VRITHVTDVYLPRLGGIEVYVAGLTGRQRLDGHRVEVIAGTPGDGTDDQVVRLGARGGPVGGLAPWLAPRLRARLRAGRPDVLHVHLGGVSPIGWAAIRAAGQAGIPTVVTVHSRLDGLRTLHRVAAGLYDWPGTRGPHPHPPLWTAVGARVAGQLERTLLLTDQVLVLPNAVERADWAPPAHLAPRRPDQVLLVSALRHTRRKRAEALVDVLAEVRRQVPAGVRLEAVLAGDGPRREAIARGVRREGLAGWVRLPGRLTPTELRALYHRADLFLAPTRLESFGIAALEARQAGVPVVAFADSGTAEVLEHGREAMLVRSDPELAAVTARLAVDPAARTAMALHNRTVPSPFGWDRALDACYRSYHQVVAAAGPGAGDVLLGARGTRP
jgi:phosphatidylinositol alpha 1,6-mannosyltransferase